MCFCFGLTLALLPGLHGADAPVHRATLVVRADPRSGKLVRTVAPGNQAARPSPAGAGIAGLVDDAARTHQVDPLLVHSMIKVESNYDAYAVSNKGAEGLMQLMPSTARSLGVKNTFDPRQNIEAGVRYLKYLQELYKDDRLALAAYNAGPGAVQKYKWVPPYAETQNYVYQVGKKYGEARRAAAQAVAKPKPAPAPAPKPDEPRKVEQYLDEHGRLHLRTR